MHTSRGRSHYLSANNFLFGKKCLLPGRETTSYLLAVLFRQKCLNVPGPRPICLLITADTVLSQGALILHADTCPGLPCSWPPATSLGLWLPALPKPGLANGCFLDVQHFLICFTF